VKVLLDINVLLYVFLTRQPHYPASAKVIALVANGTLSGIVPAHGITTLYYVARKEGNAKTAENGVDRVVQHFQIASLDNFGWAHARALLFTDFEDAAVSCIAEEAGCDWIVARNIPDFVRSAVPAITPTDLLSLLSAS
jgi:predicted nucleic acid-binding protein